MTESELTDKLLAHLKRSRDAYAVTGGQIDLSFEEHEEIEGFAHYVPAANLGEKSSYVFLGRNFEVWSDNRKPGKISIV